MPQTKRDVYAHAAPATTAFVLLLLVASFPPPAAAAATFRALAPLPFARSDHTATTMPDGLIYLLGGCDGAQNCDNTTGVESASFCACTSFTRNIAAFDAARGAYLPGGPALPPMPAPRYRHLACAVRDVIFVFGGRDLATDAMITAVDAFNATSRAWLPSSQLASYPLGPAGLGSDNSCSTVGEVIYVFGGYTQDYSVSLGTVWAFAPFANGSLAAGGAGVWTRRAGAMLTGRGDFASVTALDGRIHVYGGYRSPDFCSPLASHEIYDPAADNFTLAAPLPRALAEKDDGLVVGGLLFSIGGETKADATGCGDVDITPLTKVYSFSGATNSWSVVGDLPDGRMRFASAERNGVIYTFGGQGALLDAGSSTPFLPILYTAFSYSPTDSGGGGGGGAAAAGASYGPGDIAGAVIGTALVMLFLQGGSARWRHRSSGSDLSRVRRMPLP